MFTDQGATCHVVGVLDRKASAISLGKPSGRHTKAIGIIRAPGKLIIKV